MLVATLLVASALVVGPRAGAAEPASTAGLIAAGGVLRLPVPEAFGGKTVIGQLTVDGAVGAGYVTAYGCADGMPVDAMGEVSRSDLNYDGALSPVASNRLIVQADANGDVCLFTLRPAALIVDVNAVTFDTGVNAFPNRRTDTRSGPLLNGAAIQRINVPEAQGAKTVVGQLTVDRATQPGFVTVFGCADGLPTDPSGRVSRSDLNYKGGAAPVASNRLVAQADAAGDVCLYSSRPVAMIIDVNGVSDVGIGSFPNRRTDTRSGSTPRVEVGSVTRVSVPDAAGGRTVLGQLTVDLARGGGFVTAYGCADGLPVDDTGTIARSDLNVDGTVSPVASNRLIVKADDAGDVCFYTSQALALVVDVNGVAGAGISSFPNRRFESRTGRFTDTAHGIHLDGSRSWPAFAPAPALTDVAALTGRAVDVATAAQPILAVKIDNYTTARPQWGLERADAVIEVNVEGISRFIALFQSRLPAAIGPVRSARTEDFDLLSLMNRPIFAYSGANDGVLQWAAGADSAGLTFDFGAQHAPCFSRSPDKSGPHNLVLDTACTYNAAPTAGPARPLWKIDAGWMPAAGATVALDSTFAVPMDGVAVQWQWDVAAGVYRRFQDGIAHDTVSGDELSAGTVAVLSVLYVPSVADARSPDATTVGTGAAVVHRNGRAVSALWSRATPYAPFRFFDAATGGEIAMDAGVTWLELTRA